MTISEAKKIVNSFTDLLHDGRKYGYYFNYSSDCESFLSKMEALDLEWGDTFCIPCDFSMNTSYYLTNSAKKYKKKDDDKWFIVWDNGNIGRLQFVSSEYYCDVEEEWKSFMDTMLSYNPLDYDPMNCHIIYDVENGKKVMTDYSSICKRTKEAMQKKIKERKFEKLQHELTKLKEELEANDE